MVLWRIRRFNRAFAVLACAAMLAQAQPAYANSIDVTGDPKDVQAFKDMIKACREKSKAFKLPAAVI